MKRIIFIWIALCFAVNMKALIITGKVVTDDGNALPYANIVLAVLPDSSFITGTVSGNDGTFKVASVSEQKNRLLLKISSIGYTTVIVTPVKENIGTIVMHEENQILKGIIVTANKPLYKQKDGALITNVVGTILSKTTNMNQLLTNIPGMIVTPLGGMEVFGIGSPIVYINQRKVQNISEIKQLSPKDIKSIELITNPGARYDAEKGKAVLLITTLSHLNGRTLEWQSEISTGEFLNHNEKIKLGMQSGKLNLSATYRYDHSGYRVNQPTYKELYLPEDTHVYDEKMKADDKNNLREGQANMDYEFAPGHIAGLQWDGSFLKNNELRYGTLTHSKNDIVTSKIDIINNDKKHTGRNHLNLFYITPWSKCLNSELNIDYVNNLNHTNQQTVENDQKVASLSKGNFSLLESILNFDWKLNEKAGKLSWGSDYNYVDGSGNLYSSSASVSSSDYKEKEQRFATYIEYGWDNKQWHMHAGLRYEHLHSEYTDLLDESSSLKRNFNNLFPSATIGFHSGGIWSQTLSFASHTTRPSFRQLSNSVYYANEYMYQQGNPKLKPSVSYEIQYAGNYRWISYNISYIYERNHISFSQEISAKNPSVIISSFCNDDYIRQLRVGVTAKKNIGLWTPMLNIGYNKQLFQINYRGTSMYNEKPAVAIITSQFFQLPKSFICTLYYMYNSGGSVGNIRFQPYQSLNLSIQKSIFNDKLTMEFSANDLLRSYKFKEQEWSNNVYMKQTEEYRIWNYSLNITYRFNRLKTKYRGKNTIQNEINRL